MARPRSSSPREDNRKRGRIACKACRQAKVRCNLEKIPCARCAKLEIDCSIDPSFKRTNKQDKVQELETHVQQLQSLVSQQAAPNASPQQAVTSSWTGASPTAPVHDAVNGIRSTGPSDRNSWNTTSLTPEQQNSVQLAPGDRALGDVKLNAAQINSCFETYFEKFHPLLPILDPRKSPDEYFASSTVLFWTIISVAARVYRAHSDFLSQLLPLLNDHLWTEIGSSNKSIVGVNAFNISEIQSLLLLATWPLPNIRLWSDKSMVLSNMALTSAMHLGLHRPGYEYDYCKEKIEITQQMILERTSAWVSCYSASASLFIEHGHIPLVPTVDWTVTNICGPQPKIQIPDMLRHNLLIQRCANDAFQRLYQLSEDPAAIAQQGSFFPLMTLLESNMDSLEKEWGAQMSLLNRLRFLGNRLILQCMFFLSDESHRERRRGVLRAYESATEVVRTLVSDENGNDLLPSAPHGVLRIILRAAFVIIRVLYSTYGDRLDRENGKFLYNTAAFFIRSMTIQPKQKDQPIRVAEALRNLLLALEKNTEMRSKAPQLAVKSRGGASVTYDSLIFFRDQVKLQNKERNAPADFNQYNGSNDPSSTYSNNADLVNYTDVVVGSQWPQPQPQPDLLMNEPIVDFSDLSWMDSLGFPGLFTDY